LYSAEMYRYRHQRSNDHRFRLRLRLFLPLPFFRSNGPNMAQATVRAPRRITAPRTITISTATSSAVFIAILFCPFFLRTQWPAILCAGAGGCRPMQAIAAAVETALE